MALEKLIGLLWITGKTRNWYCYQNQEQWLKDSSLKGKQKKKKVQNKVLRPVIQCSDSVFCGSDGPWLLTGKTVAPLSSSLLLPAPTHEVHSWTQHVNTAGREGGALIKVNYNTATSNPCSQYWSTSQASFPGYSYDIPAWMADVKHQLIVLKYVISADMGH